MAERAGEVKAGKTAEKQHLRGRRPEAGDGAGVDLRGGAGAIRNMVHTACKSLESQRGSGPGRRHSMCSEVGEMSLRLHLGVGTVLGLVLLAASASAEPARPAAAAAAVLPMPLANATAGRPKAAPRNPLAYVGFKVAPTLPVPKDQRNATVLTYLMTDDTAHQSPHSERMVEAMKQRTPTGIHSVVFRDGAQNGDSRLFYMKGTDDWREPDRRFGTTSLVARGITEVQSNHPKVFEEIVKYAFDNYAGKRRYLQIYTHGGGVLGIGTDSYKTDLDGERINGDRIMSPSAFGDALRTALHGRTLDAIYFRSCLSGNLESLYELRGTAKYAIASQLPSYSTENSNITMTELFQSLAAKDTAPEDIAKQMAVQAFAKSGRTPEGKHSGYVSIVAADLGKVDDLKSSINTLVKELKSAMPREREAIVAAYDASDTMNKATMGDLWKFTHELAERVKDPGVKAAVTRVRAAQRSVMIHAKDAGKSDIGGLSIFMPKRTAVASTAKRIKYAENRFAQDTSWLAFLESIAEPEVAAEGAPVLFTDPVPN